jgi:hypothetical protein
MELTVSQFFVLCMGMLVWSDRKKKALAERRRMEEEAGYAPVEMVEEDQAEGVTRSKRD